LAPAIFFADLSVSDTQFALVIQFGHRLSSVFDRDKKSIAR
jgi:hypothetical protein